MVRETIVDRSTFLWARRAGGKVFVYRSPLVRETDELYLPVQAAVAALDARLVHRQMRQDPNMMFGEAEICWYHAPGVADDENCSIADAAWFLGYTLEEYVDLLVRDSLLVACEDGTYLPTNYAVMTGQLTPRRQ
ncbi:hypothetical protein [Lentzea roselyniae]|uniref:hypothetical protein n=1 Tax=Lentzea roselyniae TaxID=531940 RepID=UPI0031F858CC